MSGPDDARDDADLEPAAALEELLEEVADALKKSGHWNPAAGPPPPASTWDTLAVKRTGG